MPARREGALWSAAALLAAKVPDSVKSKLKPSASATDCIACASRGTQYGDVGRAKPSARASRTIFAGTSVPFATADAPGVSTVGAVGVSALRAGGALRRLAASCRGGRVQHNRRRADAKFLSDAADGKTVSHTPASNALG